jgi:hypothetical protein
VDKAALFLALAIFVVAAFVSLTLLVVNGAAPRGRLALFLLEWFVEVEFLVAAPLWLLARIAHRIVALFRSA